MNILYDTDFYKVDHRRQYPPNTTHIQSVLVPRSLKYFDGKNLLCNKIKVCDIKTILKKMFERWHKEFFDQDLLAIKDEYKKNMKEWLGIKHFDTTHLEKLWHEQKLPLSFGYLRTGEEVYINTPILAVTNTKKHAFWLVNYIETYLLREIWKPLTLYNISSLLFDICKDYGEDTCDSLDHIYYQCHDFSCRGCAGYEDSLLVGQNHLQFFYGTDNLMAAKKEGDTIIRSIPATEHSVMSAGLKENEEETYRRLINDVYPTGPISIVSDTWDYFNVLTDILPKLKKDILKRKGKVIIRPDSGNPEHILLGNPDGATAAERLGSLRILASVFGIKKNKKGYNELNPGIGLIYGEGITPILCESILKKMKDIGFASNNIIFGVGANAYQYISRDTMSVSFKSTWAKIDGKERDIFKSPVTDPEKKSLSGKFNLPLILIDSYKSKKIENISP